ncbi:sugar phosphate isomerase/epimerase [Kineosporia sp. J2-2]|uniref:Sugar phosphate isomerase/epimerase n=1 Tax=Kineosporia corallincola TaxID=2835133 RepID=A0ABS5TRZ1_9ACTN|nr:TIM barrel protein [Kineosporia corallincola]MBT0773569.1 sugar phosphate isomerase/epimerase [Kineosporia corallincola]
MFDAPSQNEASALAKALRLNRRQLFAASTGVAAAAAVTVPSGSAEASVGSSGSGRIPKSKRGIILYTVRDAIARDPEAFNGPSGFREVFAALARIGYKQVEFAGYTQHANAPGGAQLGTVEGAKQLRKWLDDNGLRAQGNHGFIPSSWPFSDADLETFKLHTEIANILGMQHIGTGADPTSSAVKADWDVAAEKWNALGKIAARAGLKLYTHNHDAAYSFLLDAGPKDAAGNPTRSSGIRRLEYFLKITDPKYVHLEMDVFWAHVAQYKFREYTAADGSTRKDVFDPAATVLSANSRFPLFHAKDGEPDTDVANGYDIVPFGTGQIDYETFFRRVGRTDTRNPMVEQDTAPGGTTAPAQSLQHARLGLQHLATL